MAYKDRLSSVLPLSEVPTLSTMLPAGVKEGERGFLMRQMSPLPGSNVKLAIGAQYCRGNKAGTSYRQALAKVEAVLSKMVTCLPGSWLITVLPGSVGDALNSIRVTSLTPATKTYPWSH